MADKRVRRSVEDRVAELDRKIAKYEDLVAKLKAKKEAALNPSKPKATRVGMATVMRKAKEQGVSAQKLLEMLNNASEEANA